MNITNKQQQQNFKATTTTTTTTTTAKYNIPTTTNTATTKTRNNDNNEEDNATTTTTIQRQPLNCSDKSNRIVFAASNREGFTNIVGESRLPLATSTTCNSTSDKSAALAAPAAPAIDSNSSKRNLDKDINNNNTEKQHQLTSSLKFVNNVIQDFLLDKICWTCNNCHSVPLILWRSSTTTNNNVVQQQQQQLKQQIHTSNNTTLGRSSTFGLDNTTNNANSIFEFNTKPHEYSHCCRHKLCSKCLLNHNNTTSNLNTNNNLEQQLYYTIGGYRNTHIEQQTNTIIKCPYDDQPMQSFQISDLQLEGLNDQLNIENLAKELVFCLNKSQGCKKSMPLNDFQAHTKDCLYSKAQCPLNCGENLTVKSLAMGHLTTCPRRPVNCDFCDEEIAWNAHVDHKKVCLKRPVSCQYCQSNNLIQEELEEHYEICDQKSRPCRFNPVCSFTGTKDECGNHEKNWEFHIDLLLRHIINDNMFASKKNRITDIIAIMKDLDNETTSLKNQLDLVTFKLDDMYKQNEEAQELILELKKENEEIKRRLNEQLPSPSNKFNDELKSTKDKLAKLETQQKADANVWRALVEVLRKEIEVLKVTINTPNITNSTSAPTTTPIEKTIVASLVGLPQLTPLQQQQQQPKTFPISISTIFEQQENEQDNYSPSPVREQMNLYINNQQDTPIYSLRQQQQQQQQTNRQQYLSDNISHKELHSQSKSSGDYAHHHLNNQNGRIKNHSEV